MEIDFRIPFEYMTITVKNIPNNQGGSTPRAVQGRVRSQWKDIAFIEEFIMHWMFPNDQRNKTCLVMYNGSTHIIVEDFDVIAKIWEEYKIWESKKDVLAFNKPN